jgi:hypothetical protein
MDNTAYQLAEKLFKFETADCVFKDGVHVCNITLKYPKNGVGAVKGFMHCIGSQMVYAQVKGAGFNKENAVIDKLANEVLSLDLLGFDFPIYKNMVNKILLSNGGGWKNNLNDFTIIQVI